MKKTYLLLGFIIFLLLSSNFANAEEKTVKESLGLFDSLKSESELSISIPPTVYVDNLFKLEPGESYQIPLDIKYQITGPLSFLHEKILKNKNANIEISVESSVNWASATITPDKLEANITSNSQNVIIKPIVSISLSEDAYANEQCKIIIKAKIEKIKGPLNLFTYVLESENITSSIAVIVGYVPKINVEPDFTEKEIPPLNTTNIPINITNIGNGKSNVNIKLLNSSDHLNVSLPDSIILEVEESKQIIVKVKPDKKFNLEYLNISFTPSYYEEPNNQYYTGNPTNLSFILENDGSYKKESDFNSLDITIILICSIIIIIILGIFYLLKKKK